MSRRAFGHPFTVRAERVEAHAKLTHFDKLSANGIDLGDRA
jgi:hypothetical protein